VSHTTHDLVFIWNMTDPLVVNPDIELPQLDISNNITTDCTIEYSTGVNNIYNTINYYMNNTRVEHYTNYKAPEQPGTTCKIVLYTYYYGPYLYAPNLRNMHYKICI